MRRPGYREAINWLACNDDCNWVIEEPMVIDQPIDRPIISVTAALVRDLFDIPDERLIADLRRELSKARAR
jgi:hypothetical protein